MNLLKFFANLFSISFFISAIQRIRRGTTLHDLLPGVGVASHCHSRSENRGTTRCLVIKSTQSFSYLHSLMSCKGFFYIHLGYSFNFTDVYLCHIMWGIPPPSGGIVGKNRSTRRKTTVRSKRVGPLGSNGAPLLGSHSDTFI